MPLVLSGAAELRARVEPWVAVGAFLGGFTWDALTLVRIDRWTDNLLLGSYLLALSVALVLEHRVSEHPEAWPRLAPRARWITLTVQFLFGGLFSAYVVFYLRSASWGPTLGFVVLLAVALVANEFRHGALQRSWLRLALLWFVAFSYLLFLLPIITGTLSAVMFAAAALGASVLGMAVGRGMFGPPDSGAFDRTRLAWFGGLTAAMTALNVAGIIPPVPLAVLELGIFHQVEPRKDEDGTTRYWLAYEAPPWWKLFVDDNRVMHVRPSDKVHAFTALFAPNGMRVHITHVWEWWDAEAGAWVPRDRIDVSPQGAIVGGRERGYRTWSAKKNVTAGDWRVRVVNDGDRELGRATFSLVLVPEGPLPLIERPWD